MYTSGYQGGLLLLLLHLLIERYVYHCCWVRLRYSDSDVGCTRVMDISNFFARMQLGLGQLGKISSCKLRFKLSLAILTGGTLVLQSLDGYSHSLRPEVH
jgi:hypothetical protein